MVLDRGGVFETSKLTQVFEDLKSINNLGFNDRFSAFRTYESWAQMLVENKDLFRMVTGALYQRSVIAPHMRSYQTRYQPTSTSTSWLELA